MNDRPQTSRTEETAPRQPQPSAEATAKHTSGVTMPAGNASRVYGVVMGVAVTCAVTIVVVHEITQPIIRANRREARQQAILDLLPGASESVAYRLNPQSRSFVPVGHDHEGADLVFAGFNQRGELMGLVMETQGMGYQDLIRLLYAYSFSDQAVIGIGVLESRETPGLGDAIEKNEDFLRNFQRLDVRLNASATELAHPIDFVKPDQKQHAWQIDGISGATISSRAVAKMLGLSASRWIPLVNDRHADFVRKEQEGA